MHEPKFSDSWYAEIIDKYGTDDHNRALLASSCILAESIGYMRKTMDHWCDLVLPLLKDFLEERLAPVYPTKPECKRGKPPEGS